MRNPRYYKLATGWKNHSVNLVTQQVNYTTKIMQKKTKKKNRLC